MSLLNRNDFSPSLYIVAAKIHQNHHLTKISHSNSGQHRPILLQAPPIIGSGDAAVMAWALAPVGW